MKKDRIMILVQTVVIIAAGFFSGDSAFALINSGIGVVFNYLVSVNQPVGFWFGVVYALMNGVIALQGGIYATAFFMFVIQAPMAVYSYISWKKKKSERDTISIHKHAHLYDRVWPMLFGNAFVKEVVLLICLEIVVCNIIIDQAGIPAIILFDPVIHPYLQVFPMFVQKRKAAVNIIQGVIRFFKEAFPAIIGRSL